LLFSSFQIQRQDLRVSALGVSAHHEVLPVRTVCAPRELLTWAASKDTGDCTHVEIDAVNARYPYAF
jgi:hypothetical protein